MVECIENPWNLPYIKIGNKYEVIGQHPTRLDYFCVKGESNTTAFYKKEWFKNES